MKIQTKITMLLFVLFAIGCSKKEDDTPVIVQSSAKQLTSFVFNASDNAALSETITVSISEAAKTASSSIPDATDVTALTPTITASAKATVSPSGAQDFSSPVIYTVTAEDGSTAAYSVSLEKEAPIATVASMSPLSGPKTTIVTFTGTNFGEDASVVQVFFDDLEAEIQSVTNTEIKTVVPPRSYSGEVKIMINGTEFTDFTFGYEIVDIQVSTIAGSTGGFTNGNGTNAQFRFPYDIALDAQGILYVADNDNDVIRKINLDGEVTTLAGSTDGFADGNGVNAQFDFPSALATDNAGNIYVADTRNFKIRKITPSGVVSTLAGSTLGFADGDGSDAKFSVMEGITVDLMGNVYVSDSGNSRIRKITPEGTVTTIAGNGLQGSTDGAGTSAEFRLPVGITTDSAGNIYVADEFNHNIRKIDLEGVVSTIAGGTPGFMDGNGTNAQFNSPRGITVDAFGNIYVADDFNHSIRKITADGEVTTIAGSTEGIEDGTGANARFNRPRGIIVDESFTLYVADTGNSRIRKITQE
ncbi:IPT/TIG domain-containing protein [Maribacter sp. R86514]|uniref:IPT/TIG domain-containing protein n=1 Tax=Maribacter sp. R86514 TaxID=3093854 RepID=UPI0037C7B452